MSNNGCRDIVYRQWPDKLEALLRVEKKLCTMKDACASDPIEFDPEEKEVLKELLDYLVKEYEKKHGSLSYLMDKFGPSIVTVILREALGKIL
jgi:hypothetical protein